MFEIQQFDVRIQIVAILIALVLMVGVIELVRRRQLRESYSIAWLFLSAIVMIFALFRQLQEVIARLIGVFYPPSLIFGALIFMLLGIVLYLCVALTRLETHTRVLAQRLALLESLAPSTAEDDDDRSEVAG
jgi:hypothetical protein